MLGTRSDGMECAIKLELLGGNFDDRREELRSHHSARSPIQQALERYRLNYPSDQGRIDLYRSLAVSEEVI